ncbi:hypothetical protein [Pseudoponticoccus marisrubri]|uniref:Uncharacterized protein n=1 Tax=Pseudoponticoccus marisrubri TaxID=1685382 RepID=A0A0W7WN21_9RHOB|nr:hypothetical protein [Pseudoponticoccus marisrubri]KUF11979.1 hypothetical protein AVJ23_05220 [Pseudoponticoccus marisrubri]
MSHKIRNVNDRLFGLVSAAAHMEEEERIYSKKARSFDEDLTGAQRLELQSMLGQGTATKVVAAG